MIVRYSLGKIDYMLISSDDIVRLIETIYNNLNTIRELTTKFVNGQIFMSKKSEDSEYASKILNLKNSLNMPQSSVQKEGYSRRKEGFEYLKRQHGDLS